MKKLILFSLVLMLSLTGLSACGKQAPSLEDRIQGSNQQGSQELFYIGVIQPIDSAQFKRGTHQLVTETKTIAIQSNVIPLDRFVNQKVQVTGTTEVLIDNKTEVFNVTAVEPADENAQNQRKVYQSQVFGFELEYPAYWQLFEESESIRFRHNTESPMTIATKETRFSFDDYVSSREAENGDEVTVGGKSALRYRTDDVIRFYVDNTVKDKVYIIELNRGGSTDEADLLKVVDRLKVFESSQKSGSKCGGDEKLTCDEGFRCELSGVDANAEGVCVPIDRTQEAANCPFVPKPEGCQNYEPKTVNRNKCPLSYVCLDEPDEPEKTDEERKAMLDSMMAEKTEVDSSEPITSARNVIAAFKEADLLPTGAEVIRHEVIEAEQVLYVIYTNASDTFRGEYEYNKIDESALSFNRRASYRATADKQWVQIEGEKTVKAEEPKDAEGSEEVAIEKTIPSDVKLDDMRFYENSYKEFTVGYPKNWYFRSFGPEGDYLWLVGFADAEVEEVTDALIFLQLRSGQPSSNLDEESGEYAVSVDRDTDTYFVVVGPTELSDTIDAIANSITNNKSNNS